MYNYDREKYLDLSYEHVNWIIEKKIYVLPHVILTHALVELIIPNGTVVVESQHHPIRHGKHCASRVHVGGLYGKIDINPKFIWDGKNKEWLLNTFGTAVFAEIEINEPPKVCVCNQ